MRGKKESKGGLRGPGAVGGEVHPPLRGQPLLATSPGIPFVLGSPRNLLFSMPASASIFDNILKVFSITPKAPK